MQNKHFHRNFEGMPSQDKELSGFVAFRVSENMLQKLKQKAEQEGTDISNMIRGFLEKCL